MKSSESVKELKILHLDDDAYELERVRKTLNDLSHDVRFKVVSVSTPETFFKKLSDETPDIVVLDINLRGAETGLGIAKPTRDKLPNVVILMCSSMDDALTIRNCLAAGADDFISKRTDSGELGHRIYSSFVLTKLKRGVEIASIWDDGKKKPSPAFAGNTLAKINNRIGRILNSALTAIHISGESGTGKEVTADLFAARLPSDRPFIKVNCAAIAPNLLESELFGRVKGAFTGATSDRKGLIESANGGWIFLDEVATLTLQAQAALLRTIENQEIIRVGDNSPRSINVKFISATNEVIPELVEQKKFRMDLWQRLCEAEIKLSPLRERPDEIESLVKHFCETMPGGPYEMTHAALEVLCAAPWEKGNVRELRNCLKAMTELHVNRVLTPLAIPDSVWDQVGEAKEDAEATTSAVGKGGKSKSANGLKIEWNDERPNYDQLADLLLIEMTRMIIAENGKVSLRSLAKEVGLSRSTLSSRFKSIVHKGIMKIEEISELVGISEK